MRSMQGFDSTEDVPLVEAYLLARMKRTPSKYFDEAEPIINAKARMILLNERNNVNGLLQCETENRR